MKVFLRRVGKYAGGLAALLILAGFGLAAVSGAQQGAASEDAIGAALSGDREAERVADDRSDSADTRVAIGRVMIYGGVAFAVVAAVAASKSRRMPEDGPTPVTIVGSAPPPPLFDPGSPSEIAKRLEGLKSLLDAGSIDATEYEVQRKKIIESI